MTTADGATSAPHGAGQGHRGTGVPTMALSATLHCLTGCAVGEIAGLVIGTALGMSNLPTIVLSIALAFVFGYTLSTLPLVRTGLPLRSATRVVLAADTVSIATMELSDNTVMAVIPGAMNAGLVNVLFWVGMLISLAVAFVAAFPVNAYLLARGKGHSLTHEFHGVAAAEGWRSRVPAVSTGALVAVLLAFILGGLVVALAVAERDHGGAAVRTATIRSSPDCKQGAGCSQHGPATVRWSVLPPVLDDGPDTVR